MLVTPKAGCLNHKGGALCVHANRDESTTRARARNWLIGPQLAPWEMNDGVGVFDIK